ncbi:uncharacterized protein LTR77_006356 [Saxophila tyrrhenica]|uniref:Uncharacterized protein n=1 Tax=Saxophila tyrrhenica TaxID=1690608 RepID=A0AAV9P893_9PEZI|nr:hypothetical protein LTR77_006356 [Saxophila tyrrhenica]
MAGLANLIPLLVLFIVIGGGGYVGYQIYLWSNEMTDRGKKHMEKKHMSFTKDGGLKVGVKERTDEAYTDKTQNVLVNVWNNAQPGSAKRTNSSQARPSTSRTASSASASGKSNLSPPVSRSNTQRPASPVPGSF